MDKNTQNNFYSTNELAEKLGVSRVSIFKKIKTGKIKASKVGRNYIIPKEEYENILGLFVSAEKKKEFDQDVKKVVKEYKDALDMLGKE